MALISSKSFDQGPKLGFVAPPFSLPGVDGKLWSLSSFTDQKALLVVFMCNHCPYVIAVQERINGLAKRFQNQGLAVVGINPNDSIRYPADSLEAMKVRAREQGYVFPYLQDESQEVARAYDAVCTPDLYLFGKSNEEFTLRYHGRIDDHWKDASQVTRHELAEAIETVLQGQLPSETQQASMGCSIKWKAN